MLGDRTRRMMRGMAAHTPAVAVLVTVHNIRTIERHLVVPRPQRSHPTPVRRARRRAYASIIDLLHEAQAPPSAHDLTARAPLGLVVVPMTSFERCSDGVFV